MATIPGKQSTSKTGDPFIVRSAQPDDAAKMIDYMQAVTRESDFLLIEPGEFEMTDDEEREDTAAGRSLRNAPSSASEE